MNKINVKRRNVQKKEPHFFDYSALAKNMWSDRIKKGHDHFNIHFDHENDEGTGGRRIITYDIPDDSNHRTGKEEWRFKCDMYAAGGDWQESSLYFRCQITDGCLDDLKQYPHKLSKYGDSFFIVIPPASAGNTRIQKGDGVAQVVMDSCYPDNAPELDEKKAWKYLESYLNGLVDEHIQKRKVKRMLDNPEDMRCTMYAKMAKRLDEISDNLEKEGLIKEAEDLDSISNTLEKMSAEDEKEDDSKENEPTPETTVGINPFATRQYRAPTGNDPSWTIVSKAKMEEIRKKVEDALRAGRSTPGYNPKFVRNVKIKDPTILSPIVKITPENKEHLYDHMAQRQEGEKSFSGTYFDANKVQRQPSDHINVGLYTRQQLERENSNPTGADYDIITVNAEPESKDSPMTPRTMERNKDILLGGSGHEHSQKEMSAGEKYWMEHAMVR